MGLLAPTSGGGGGGISEEEVGGTTGSTDNAILRADGTGGATAQGSNVYVTDGTTPTVQLGGTTSSFPAIGRSATETDAVLVSEATGTTEKPIRASAFKAASGGASFTGTGALAKIQADGGLELSNTAYTEMRYMFASVYVLANGAVGGGPYGVLSYTTGAHYTNEGSTVESYHTLPSAVAGYKYTFIVQDADGLRITAAAGDTIRPGTVAASATGGYIRCATQGASITLVAINATEWMATSMIGTWTVDS